MGGGAGALCGSCHVTICFTLMQAVRLSNARFQIKILEQQIADDKAVASSEASVAALGHQEQAKSWQQVKCDV